MEKGKNIDTKSLQTGRKTFTQSPTWFFGIQLVVDWLFVCGCRDVSSTHFVEVVKLVFFSSFLWRYFLSMSEMNSWGGIFLVEHIVTSLGPCHD